MKAGALLAAAILLTQGIKGHCESMASESLVGFQPETVLLSKINPSELQETMTWIKRGTNKGVNVEGLGMALRRGFELTDFSILHPQAQKTPLLVELAVNEIPGGNQFNKLRFVGYEEPNVLLEGTFRMKYSERAQIPNRAIVDKARIIAPRTLLRQYSARAGWGSWRAELLKQFGFSLIRALELFRKR